MAKATKAKHKSVGAIILKGGTKNTTGNTAPNAQMPKNTATDKAKNKQHVASKTQCALSFALPAENANMFFLRRLVFVGAPLVLGIEHFTYTESLASDQMFVFSLLGV